MSMFNTVKDIFTKTAKDAVKASNTAVEYAKLKFKLSETNDKIKENYAQIGKLIYSTSIGEQVDSDDVEKICNEITELLKQAEEYEEAINKASNKKLCPECGVKIPNDSVFCPKCGNKLADE